MTRVVPKKRPKARVKPKAPPSKQPQQVPQSWLYASLERVKAAKPDSNGWIRLATVKGSEGRTYAIAIRRSALGVQFVCTCPDHWHKARLEQRTCKHQRAFLLGSAKPTNAGKVFLALDAKTLSEVP